MSNNKFVHLRIHSSYTPSGGVSSPRELIDTARAANFSAIGLSDHGNMLGALQFSEYAAKNDMRPILGCQMAFAFAEGKSGDIVLIAKNMTGYKNLCRLLSIASRRQPHEITPSDLESRANGLILLTGGGENGLLPALVAYNKDWARDHCHWFLGVFEDRVYVEICRNSAPSGSRNSTEETLLAMAMGDIDPAMCGDGVIRSHLPIVGTSDVWYADRAKHEAWLSLDTVAKKQGGAAEGVYYNLKSSDEMAKIFADLPSAYYNTAKIARMCSPLILPRQATHSRFLAAEGGGDEVLLRNQGSGGTDGRPVETDPPAMRV